VDDFAAQLAAAYQERVGRQARVLICTPSEGVSRAASY
jgi:hypothetical protein